jgi:beta-N-acetylhexosaminidase
MEEQSFFADSDPLGFILFQRNCENPEQVRALVASLRETVRRPDTPILIDQEGGRVQRLKPPYWRDVPAAACFADLFDADSLRALEAVHLNSRLIAHELSELGISINCAPVLDLPQPGADLIIGDRAYGSDPAKIATLATAACKGFLAGCVLPVVKHIPGHGRANVDSHKALPFVDANIDTMVASDFAPFKDLSAMPWAMTAHVLYKEMDKDKPATMSTKVIKMIRNDIGFDGVLLSDDLSMQALDGSLKYRAAGALVAGCDVVLHCNGDMVEMLQVASGGVPLSNQAIKRIERAEKMRLQNRAPFEGGFSDAVQRLEAMMT